MPGTDVGVLSTPYLIPFLSTLKPGLIITASILASFLIHLILLSKYSAGLIQSSLMLLTGTCPAKYPWRKCTNHLAGFPLNSFSVTS